MTDEEEFLAGYDPSRYPAVAVTVDVVALTIRDGVPHVLLVERGRPPFQGLWALPGGFVKVGAEDLDTAAARELAEETGLETPGRVHLEQLATYGDPGRDPRMPVVSVAYLAFGPTMADPQAGSDASDAAWVPVPSLGLTASGAQPPGATRRLAFDHARILSDGLERARGKLEYTPLATAFLPEVFTIPELRAVYECVWGEALHAGNFHRKVLSVPGFVEGTGQTTASGGRRGGPRARLYRSGDARLLHPALLRPGTEDGVR
ncbi:NUDIX hydrolase [Actinocorallia sp. API 0066]|uniref:NUDIX hydrolase n=1 Tax=Actinocorallia sp. API 0066 TaxID=2896846 RepID=UPI001E510DCF|nr:NUDIX domain-containing protein [Actinocorallia sp. API 0066]MCD0451065.1 NUDIX hydrolase [Actinocorallia sp. API 0066]